MQRILVGVGVAVVVGGIIWAQHAYIKELREDIAACAARIKPMQEAADKAAHLQIERDAAAKQAKQLADKLARRADGQLGKPAAIPGDDCGSARIRAADWLSERRK